MNHRPFNLSDRDLKDEAVKAGFPSIGFAREVYLWRERTVTSLTTEERREAREQMDKVILQARSVQRFRVLISIASGVFGILTFAAYLLTAWYGYREFVASRFGLPAISPLELFAAILTVKYVWKGYADIKRIKEREEDRKRQEDLLWLDRIKEVSSANASNLGGAAMVSLTFFLVSIFA